MQQGQPPDDVRAPVVADERRIVVAVVVEQCDEVAGEVFDVVVGDVGRACDELP